MVIQFHGDLTPYENHKKCMWVVIFSFFLRL